MEDFIIREIDRIGELLMKIVRKLGLLEGEAIDYTMDDIKEEFDKASIPFDPVAALEQESPVLYLMETVGLSDHGLELFVDIIFNSDIDDSRKDALLADAITYLDGKGYYSFRLHSLIGN